MASIGPPALGAKGCVRSAQGGRRLAVRTAMEHPIAALPRTPFPASRDFPSRGNEKIGGTGYCVTYDTDSQSRNVLASPLGEEGHEVAKGCTRVRMIMILEVDVTAERRHCNTHRPRGRYHNPRPEGPSNLRTFPFTTLLHNPRRQPRPFFKNCGEAATTTLGLKGRQT